jgi:hypothetical protein
VRSSRGKGRGKKERSALFIIDVWETGSLTSEERLARCIVIVIGV